MTRHRKHDEETFGVGRADSQADGGLEEEAGLLSADVDELQAEVERLRSELEEEKKRTKEAHDQKLRALADFTNYKRRTQEECARTSQFATQEFILKILPVIDNFERAIESAEKSESFDSLIGGVKLTLRQLEDILEKEGITPIEAVGHEFDPMLHEAVMRVETDHFPENTIVEELQTGYMQQDRVIRPTKVKVAVSPD
jgi:molecular chaperone GrpE